MMHMLLNLIVTINIEQNEMILIVQVKILAATVKNLSGVFVLRLYGVF